MCPVKVPSLAYMVNIERYGAKNSCAYFAASIPGRVQICAWNHTAALVKVMKQTMKNFIDRTTAP